MSRSRLRRVRRFRRTVVLAFVAAICAPGLAGGGGGEGGGLDAAALAHPGFPALEAVLPADRVRQGKAVYDFHCTTCHGATGAGFAEARSAFPADHYDCFRCHGRDNPAIMSPHQIESSQTVFSLGDPPSVRDAAGLARYGTIGGLLDYVRAAMPRWSPGRLTDEESLDVTLYLVSLAYGEAAVAAPATGPRAGAGPVTDQGTDDAADAADAEAALRSVRLPGPSASRGSDSEERRPD